MRQTKTPIAELAYGKNSSLICSEWNIDSFDQCSVELAKQSVGRIIPELESKENCAFP